MEKIAEKQGEQRMKRKLLSLGKVLIAFLVFEVLSFVIPELLAIFLKSMNLEGESLIQWYQAGSSLIVMLVAFPGFVLVMRCFGRLAHFSWKESKKASGAELLRYILISILPVAVLYGVMLAISRARNIPLVDMIGTLSVGDVVREALLGCLLMPAMEEMMFRGIMLHTLKREGNLFAVIVTTLFFAAGHNNPVNMLLGLVTGCIFGYITIRHEGIRYAYICHVIVNILGNLVIPGICGL